MSPSPSPLMGRIDRHQSASPPQQLSKRDKRRTMLADRLAEITMQFSANRDAHYREQLQGIQIDMNLIMEADAQRGTALPDSADDIESLVHDNIRSSMMKSIGPIPPPRAGRLYANFAKEINDAIEARDAALTMHKVCNPRLFGCKYHL